MPVLIVAYMRSEYILKYATVLREAKITNAYLAVDGCKEESQYDYQDKMVATIVQEFSDNGIKLRVWRRTQNLGAAVSVISAIDWFFRFESEGIILEDDLYFERDFVGFANKSLEEFKNQTDVWLISGNQFLANKEFTDQPIFTHYPLIWGWATWKNRWNEIRKSILAESAKSRQQLKRAEFFYWKVGKDRALSGKIDAWDISLVLPMRLGKKICVLPPVNLVSNLGADSLSTHTVSPSWPLMHPIQKYNVPKDRFSLDFTEILTGTDETLASDFFKIRKRHVFLPVYARWMDLSRPRKFKNTLASRLQEISVFPEMENLP